MFCFKPQLYMSHYCFLESFFLLQCSSGDWKSFCIFIIINLTVISNKFSHLMYDIFSPFVSFSFRGLVLLKTNCSKNYLQMTHLASISTIYIFFLPVYVVHLNPISWWRLSRFRCLSRIDSHVRRIFPCRCVT